MRTCRFSLILPDGSVHAFWMTDAEHALFKANFRGMLSGGLSFLRLRRRGERPGALLADVRVVEGPNAARAKAFWPPGATL